jgi:hypothetical protein
MGRELQSTGVHIQKDTLDYFDQKADEYDVARSAVIRGYLRIAARAADEMTEEEIRDEILLMERATAPEMTEAGHHPRWDR